MIAPRIAPSVRPRTNSSGRVRSSERRLTPLARRTQDRHDRRRSPIPTQATIDAPSRWKSPIISTSSPSRSASASPAHAPRIGGHDEERQPTAGLPRMSTYSEAWKIPTSAAEDERRVDAHQRLPAGCAGVGARGVPAAGRRAIRPPPITTSPSYRTAAWPGAAAQTGASVSTVHRPPRAARRRRGTHGRRDRRRLGDGSGSRPGTASRPAGASPATKLARSSSIAVVSRSLAAPERDRVGQRDRSG